MDYTHTLTQDLLRTDGTGIPKLVYEYIPTGRGNVG